MTKRQSKNIAASVREQLLNKARKADRPFSELLQYFHGWHPLLSTKESNLGVAGVNKALRRAEWVFRENPKIKQRILSATGKE